MKLSILYRGPLSSCNYGCPYCPFAKHTETDAEHKADARALERFTNWITSQTETQFSIFFTPWGEALIRTRYQRALVRLTNLPNVDKAAIQTNGSCGLRWTDECNKAKLGLWVTFHPGETSRAEFLARCGAMTAKGLRYSVGVVGLKEHQGEIAALRAELPPEVYLWINAFKRVEDYYSAGELAFLESIDPLFPVNNVRHPSQGLACNTGEWVISVDGEGTVRRCHFVKTPIGNIYEPDWQSALKPRTCTNETCGCHIGYVHMPSLGLDRVFGEGILERIPVGPLKYSDSD